MTLLDGRDALKAVTLPAGLIEALKGNTVRLDPPSLAKAYTASVWAYRCIAIRANTLAGIPWDVTIQDKSVGDGDPLRTLLDTVGDELNWEDLIRATESDALVYGAAYWAKERPVSGRLVKSLMRLNPLTIEVVTDISGIQGFVQRINGKKIAEWPRQDVVYFRDYNPLDDLGGLSSLSVAMNAVSAEREATAYVASFFRNYALPPVILSSEQPLGEKAITEVKKWWDRLFKGADKQHKTGIMGNGLKPFVVGYPTKDLALPELKEDIRRDVCAVFGVPPAIAGAWEAANYAASKEQRQSLYEDAVFPRARYYRGVIQAELVSEFQGGRKFLWQINKLPIMQPDRESEARIHKDLVSAGIEGASAAAAVLGVTPPTPDELAQLQSRSQSQSQGSAVMSAKAPVTREELAEADLAKWERKALKRLKGGKPAQCDFESESIPAGLKGAVLGALEGAETAADIRRAFASAMTWSEYP